MTDQPADTWRELLRAALLTARKDRDQTRISALRSALSAIDNAETPDTPAPSAGAIEGAVGLGAAEVTRRTLTDDDIRALLRGEIAERITAADLVTADRAAALRAEADVIAALLGDV